MATLRHGDGGEPVKGLQRSLNRLGSLLLVDGDFGRGTEAAVLDACVALKLPSSPVVDDAFTTAIGSVPEPSLELTAPGVAFIGREEVSSPDEYRRRYVHPELPPPDSGITIGIGYDLKFVDRAKLGADWGEVLEPGVLDRLAAVSGTTGTQAMLAQVRDIVVPLLGAVRVFLDRMMPEYVASTRRIYPSLDALPPARRTALISLVFNRGSDLAGDRRREMKAIQEHLAAGRLNQVAEQFESMTRLWDPGSGLVTRRRREATLWRQGFEALQLA